MDFALGGIAVDAAGNVYIAERRQPSLQKLTATGRLLASWPL